MSVQAQQEAASPNPSGFYNNGRALIVSIQDFRRLRNTLRSKGLDGYYGPLGYTHESGEFFKEILKFQSGSWGAKDYASRNYRMIQDSDATYLNIISGILTLASEAVPGDVVTITFSTHGESVPTSSRTDQKINLNYVALYDEFLSEFELYVLLRLFKKGVRIFVCFDCCHSGSWMNFNQLDYYDATATLSNIMAKLENTGNRWASELLKQNYSNMVENFDISASACMVGGLRDAVPMNDYLNSARFYLYNLADENREMPIREFISRTRSVIYKAMENNYRLKIGSIFPYWFALYEEYVEKKKNPVVDESLVYNPNNSKHVTVVRYFCPTVGFIGKDTDIFDEVPAFGLY
ncbi:MAG: caspase family protein [Flavobacteriales bacterium]|nr:caspase family protein [Flavobacteriales bacterium]